MGEAIMVRRGASGSGSKPRLITEIITWNQIWSVPNAKNQSFSVRIFGGGGSGGGYSSSYALGGGGGYGCNGGNHGGGGGYGPAGQGGIFNSPGGIAAGRGGSTKVIYAGGDGICIIQYYI